MEDNKKEDDENYPMFTEEYSDTTMKDNEEWEKHMDTFGSWLRARLMNDDTVGDQLYLLAALLSSTVLHFQGYEINGNTFYTTAYL